MTPTVARTAGLALLCISLTTGCFTVRHKLPPNAYFGKLPGSSGKKIDRVTHHGTKNWLLAGLAPYSGWSSENLLERNGHSPGERVENLAIETRFGTLDTIIWVVPGFFYGYYIWAPRTVEVTGTRVSRDRRGR